VVFDPEGHLDPAHAANPHLHIASHEVAKQRLLATMVASGLLNYSKGVVVSAALSTNTRGWAMVNMLGVAPTTWVKPAGSRQCSM